MFGQATFRDQMIAIYAVLLDPVYERYRSSAPFQELMRKAAAPE